MKSKIVSVLKNVYRNIKYYRSILNNPKNLHLFFNPTEVPFVIINFNQLHYLKKLVDFAKKREFKNIVIIDNVSTYKPLLEYYESIKNEVTIEKMDQNYGHLVFFNNEEIYNKYGKSFFILTDADIESNENLPENFMRIFFKWILKRDLSLTKVGFALDTENIPQYYSEREKVLKWEKQFWENEIEKNAYLASIDTTFALYRPNPKKYFYTESHFFRAVRLGGDFTCKHGGWFIDYNHLTEEQAFYINLATNASSWIDTKRTQRDSPIETDSK